MIMMINNIIVDWEREEDFLVTYLILIKEWQFQRSQANFFYMIKYDHDWGKTLGNQNKIDVPAT